MLWYLCILLKNIANTPVIFQSILFTPMISQIYKGFLDAAGALIVDPLLVFEGRIDSPMIQEDPDAGTAAIAVSASNSWVDFERRIGRFTNHEGQQVYFPGDMGLEFASEIVKDVVWGKAG